MPEGTKAVYFYVEPNPFTEQTFTATEQPSGVTTGPFPVVGDSGARYVGFYATGADTIQSIEITASSDFATGEFGWAGAGAGVGGTVTGQAGFLVLCRNQTTTQQVIIPLGGGQEWDCVAQGLVVNPGDVIIQLPIGVAQ
jgi:hypothetical protein